MGIMYKTLRSLFPRGNPWKFPANLKALIEALAESLDDNKDYLAAIVTESNPATATDTLEEWFDMLGITYDPTQSLATLRNRARQAFTSLGGQNLDYLNEQIQIAYPDVYIVEYLANYRDMVGAGMVGLMETTSYPSWLSTPPTDGSLPVFFYLVTGYVDTTYDLNGVLDLLSRIAPLTHTAELSVTIRNLTPTAQVGIGMIGLMMVGRE